MQNVQCFCWSWTICAWIFKALGWELFNAAIKSRTFAEDPDIRSRHIETRTKWPGMNKNMEGPGKVCRIYLTWLSLQLFGETVVMWGTGVGFCFRLLLANNGFGVTMQFSFKCNDYNCGFGVTFAPFPICIAALVTPLHTQSLEALLWEQRHPSGHYFNLDLLRP